MKPEYLYVLLDTLGQSWAVTDQDRKPASMASLLHEGWVPIRETPFHTTGTGLATLLILLERAPEGEMGFGFRKG